MNYTPWTTTETRVDERTERYSMRCGDEPLTLGQWLEALASDRDFRSCFNAALGRSAFAAYFFETPAATVDALATPFEWVLIEGAPLQRMRPDVAAFEEHFVPEVLAVGFNNLGGDAQLIAPTPVSEPEAYVHLANFVRRAPPSQVDYLWQLVARTYQRSLGKRPLWLSTSGLGIGWLHVRLDERPKYYHHAPYVAARD